MQKLLINYFQQTGILNASAHSLRHTFAVHHIVNGTGLKTLQRVLGHQDIRMTEAYRDLARVVTGREMETNSL